MRNARLLERWAAPFPTSGSRGLARCSGGVVAAFAALVFCFAAACELDAEARFSGAESLASQRFGDDDQMTLSISPGRVSSIAADGAAFALAAVASGPFPSVVIDNGTLSDRRASLTLGNVGSSWEFAPRVGPLTSTARRDPACPTESDEQSVVLLASATPSAVSGTTVLFDLQVPACSQLELRAQPAAADEIVRVAVVGSPRGDSAYLRDALSTVSTLNVDYVQFLGDVGSSNDEIAFEQFEASARETGSPYGVLIASEDRFAQTEFVSRFGGSDYTSDIGQMRWIALDTASGELTDAQFSAVGSIEPRRPPGVCVTSVAPLPFGTTRGLRSAAQGARLIEDLATRGVGLALSAGGPRHASREFGEIEVYDLAGAGAARPSLALLEFRRPWPSLRSCTTSVDCDSADRCDRGFCRTPCTDESSCSADEVCRSQVCRRTCGSSDGCPGPIPECVSGVCELDPTIELSLRAL